MQDMEFTIEHGKLYMLQTRNGKRTAAAALKIAVDLVDEGKITEKERLLWEYVLSAYGAEEFTTKQLEKDFRNAAYSNHSGA